ncbi:hypothetical protein D9M70_638320 [compost metagenome]
MDLRAAQHPDFRAGTGTGALWRAFRNQVPYMAEDRRNDTDIVLAAGFLAQGRHRPEWAGLAP